MRILMITHSFNSLAQRLHVELRAHGHELTVELDINDDVTMQAAYLFQPDIVLAPFLKRRLPASLTSRCICLIVHPGPEGDRGPAALDHSILDQSRSWGVTVLQATAEYDAGPVWASAAFSMRKARKSSLYLNEVASAAAQAVLEAIDRIKRGESPRLLDAAALALGWRGPVPADIRAIDWSRDDTGTVLRKIASADGMPGCPAELCGRSLRLFNAREAEPAVGARAGTLIARSGEAIAVATCDGAVWIGHVADAQSRHPFKRPAIAVLGEQAAGLPVVAVGSQHGFKEIVYAEHGRTGVLTFSFYNGAMGTSACQRLLKAYRSALQRDTTILLLCGSTDHFCNGLDLNTIEAATSPADESLANITAMDDLSEAIIRTTDRLTIAAVGGNAGAGGVFLARAADEMWLRSSVILNPHYKDMGNLYGSEYWTYLLPLHAGAENAERIRATRLPVGAAEALRLGLANRLFDASADTFNSIAVEAAIAMTVDPDLPQRIASKQQRRALDEAAKPLDAYRQEELSCMRRNFYGFDTSYHIARSNFVRKTSKARTPSVLAAHRRPAAAIGSGGKPA
ncbi:enoyl-CoA hydratase-related protein (plasmid) [Rhizobium sp. T1470]|uniref:enoyl-CoA hydratase-related protein n=1 Tax=unclassified Rhizobium TaxID=2613769 RepID=UPI001AAF133C|nr:enoyl-CoA hydratase-related protein [Rhizobium sp. T1473]MCA0806448.1 hydrogenase maturation protein [Rhizobium sp. T1473]